MFIWLPTTQVVWHSGCHWTGAHCKEATARYTLCIHQNLIWHWFLLCIGITRQQSSSNNCKPFDLTELADLVPRFLNIHTRILFLPFTSFPKLSCLLLGKSWMSHLPSQVLVLVTEPLYMYIFIHRPQEPNFREHATFKCRHLSILWPIQAAAAKTLQAFA